MLSSIVHAGVFAAIVLSLASTLSAASESPARLPGCVRLPEPSAILASLRKGHPRLLADAAAFDRLREAVAADPLLQRWMTALRTKARAMLAEPVSAYEIPDGLRLLSTSRRVLDRAQTLALLARIDGDARCVDRLWKELEAAAAFPDWNPRHFLDTAEMTAAFALAYDWLNDRWTPTQRKAIEEAIIKHGLTLGLDCYEGRSKHGWWTKATHNWNQVCNGGLLMGALALAEVRPDLAAAIAHHAVSRLPLALVHYGPDGAWDEGPGYWQYATTYTVYALASLDSALGSDFGLGDIPGVDQAGWFPIYNTGPLGLSFNFADTSDKTAPSPQMLYLARRYRQPAFARWQLPRARPHALDLLWHSDSPAPDAETQPPLDRCFRGAEVVTMRSGWDDANATFIGFKAGDNKANHGNLDLGSFVLDALGERWVVDLGKDDYNLPGYFNGGPKGKRWNFYRMRAEGHNTLIINPGPGPDQDPMAATRIVRFVSADKDVSALADLTPAYADAAQTVQRGLRFDRSRVLVQDGVMLKTPGDVCWFMHTPAAIALSDDGRTATLSIKDKRLVARLLSPEGARFSVMDALPLPTSPVVEKQAKNEGVRKLAVRVTGVTRLVLAVELTPLAAGMELPAPMAVESPDW